MSLVKQYFPGFQGEGAGATVMRLIGNNNVRSLDPFLMLDYFCLRLPAGFPDHPHRGFETVTYITQGTVYHEDFKGHKDRIDAGDLQWMTAGRGIVHAEMPGTIDTDTKGFQLWVNLPRAKKMMAPEYQEMKSKEIKEFNDPDGGLKVRVIAGDSNGVEGGVKPHSVSMMLDVWLGAGKEFKQKVAAGWQGLLFMYVGDQIGVSCGGSNWTAKFEQANVFEVKAGSEQILVKNVGSKPSKFILIAGKALGEPVKQHGPFVMCTDAEIEQTFKDYQEEKNGFEGRGAWKSQIRRMAKDIHWRPDL
jgi:redox-sensitive bicupin YhaK (pirin superfamily)